MPPPITANTGRKEVVRNITQTTKEATERKEIRDTKQTMDTKRERKDTTTKKDTVDTTQIMVDTRRNTTTMMDITVNTMLEKKERRDISSGRKGISKRDIVPKEDTMYIN